MRNNGMGPSACAASDFAMMAVIVVLVTMRLA
jgi:hypothetical protein